MKEKLEIIGGNDMHTYSSRIYRKKKDDMGKLRRAAESFWDREGDKLKQKPFPFFERSNKTINYNLRQR